MKPKILIIILSTLFIISCSKKDELHNTQNIINEPKLESTLSINTHFAKALSKGIENVELMNIIKSEALLKFDKDYDVLFSQIKDIKLSNGKTVLEYLSNYSELPHEKFIQEVEKSVLLTVFIPSLANFSPDTWNTNTQVPMVAVRNEIDITANKKLQAFNHGISYLSLSYLEEPNVPVIVVKNNERIISENALDFKKFIPESLEKTANRSIIMAKNNEKLYFRSPDFENVKSSKIASAIDPWDPNYNITYQDGQGPGFYLGKLWHGYFKEYSFSFDRDCIYYSLKNDADSGAFDNTYAEAIYGFYFNNSLSEITLDALNNDWTEGVYEIYVTILFVDGNSIKDVKKGFSVSKDDLFMNKNGTRVSKYFHLSPIEIASWDMQKYGDSWKFLIEEYNFGEVKKYTTNVTSNFSTNFKIDGSFELFKIIKMGASGGIGTSTTKSSAYEVTTTTSSFNLGEAILDFDDPVELIGRNAIAEYPPLYHIVNAPLEGGSTRTRGLNTGLVTLIVAPWKRINPLSDTQSYYDDAFYWLNNY